MECYMITYAAHPTTPRHPSITLFSYFYCAYFPKYYSVPRCYTEAPDDYSTEAAKYFSALIYTTTTEAVKYYAVPSCYPKAFVPR